MAIRRAIAVGRCTIRHGRRTIAIRRAVTVSRRPIGCSAIAGPSATSPESPAEAAPKATPAAEAETSTTNRIHEPWRLITRAVPCRTACHRPHSSRTCSISTWHETHLLLRSVIQIILSHRETASSDRRQIPGLRRTQPDRPAIPGAESIAGCPMRQTRSRDLQWHWGLPESHAPGPPPKLPGQSPRT